MKVLALNAGSNSLKFEVVAIEPGADDDFGTSLVSGSYDDIGKDSSGFARLENKKPVEERKLEVRDHRHATELLLAWLEKGEAKRFGVAGLGEIDRIAHRIVHGGRTFDAPAKITDEVVREVEKLEELAPLHNGPALTIVREAAKQTEDRVPMYAVFDTVFHRTIPDEASRYALPVDVADRHGIRRYGFHGISHRYLMLRHAKLAGVRLADTRLVTMHLEGGSSMCAIRGGKSIDTSMGFTPLEGLVMGTRTGDLDPAVVTYLMRKEKLDAAGVEKLLNKQSGLLGVSGVSADTRELAKKLDDPHVRLAVDMFAYRARKYVGAYLAALGGATAIVVGGGIGENGAFVRERILAPLAWAGIELDAAANEAMVDREGVITTKSSRLPVWVIPTQEAWMMARETANVDAAGGS